MTVGEVRTELVIGAPPSRVWQALADAETRRHWWSYLEIEPVAGAPWIERWVGRDGREVLTRGTVTEVVPERLLRLTWADDGWPAETTVEISLTPAGDESVDGTMVGVRHRGWHLLPDGDQLAREHAAGWEQHLADLRRVLE